MPTITITGVTTLTRSPDGQEVTISFSTKYVGEFAITMPAHCVDELISTLGEVTEVPGVPTQPTDLAAMPAQPAAEPTQAAAHGQDPKAPTELKVTVPKTWIVTADLHVHGVVLLVFDHQTEARVGYALGADAAQQMAVGLTKNSEAVLNSKAIQSQTP